MDEISVVRKFRTSGADGKNYNIIHYKQEKIRMKWWQFSCAVIIVYMLTACGNKKPQVSQVETDLQGQTQIEISNTEADKIREPQDGNMEELKLSDMVIRIISGDLSATFQLYDTEAETELYSQFPLRLELANFREAQWMFYPPKKLNVTDEKSYHDGKKGELSYYAPWDDVFMLYEDFYDR